MANLVALIRGVGPGNPSLRNEKLTGVLEKLGCANVRPVLASGNLVFRSAVRRTQQLEAKIELALVAELGVCAEVIVRRQDELEAMVKSDPFQGAEHGKRWYLTVTFRKEGLPPVFNRLERGTMDGPEFMLELERTYGKRITTRTWNTLGKILATMQAAP